MLDHNLIRGDINSELNGYIKSKLSMTNDYFAISTHAPMIRCIAPLNDDS